MEKYNAFVFTDLRQQQALKNCWNSFSLILNHRKPTQFTNNTLSDTKDVNSCLNQWYCSCLKTVNYTIWMVLLKYRNNKTLRLVCVVGYFENQWKYHHVWTYIVGSTLIQSLSISNILTLISQCEQFQEVFGDGLSI